MDFCRTSLSLPSDRMISKFEEYRQNLKFCDVSLQSGHVVVQAHRVVLAAASPYFKAMFNSGFRESSEEVIYLPSIHPEVLPTLVDFMYTGHARIKLSMAQHLMMAAHMLCLEDLVTNCAHYLKTHVDSANALSVLSFAEILNCSELAEYTLAFIGEHWAAVVQGKEFLELSLALFTRILSSEKFAVDNELEVVCGVVHWLEHSPVARAPHCAELLCHLRLGRVPINVLDDVWNNMKDPELAEVLRLSMDTMESDARARGLGAFYVVGNPKDGLPGSVMRYNIYELFWEVVAPMRTIRHRPSVAALGGRLYVIGGYNDGSLASGDVYDPATNKWSPIAAMGRARDHFGLAAVAGKLYAFGGHGVDGVLSCVEAYDPAENRWDPVGDLPYAMRDVSATACDGAVYLAHRQSLLRYEPASRAGAPVRWHACANMGAERYERVVVALYGRLYALGGYDLDDRATNFVECYDPYTDRWQCAAAMPGRERCAAGAADGTLLAVGASGLRVYVACEGRWVRGPGLPWPCTVAGAAVL